METLKVGLYRSSLDLMLYDNVEPRALTLRNTNERDRIIHGRPVGLVRTNALVMVVQSIHDIRTWHWFQVCCVVGVGWINAMSQQLVPVTTATP